MEIQLKDYTYPLSDNQIAKFPLNVRHNSRLLVYQNQQIVHDTFLNLSNYLKSESLMVFNETKVIQARLFFRKSTGAMIEIFCLEPDNLNDHISNSLYQKKHSEWKCLVGNRKKWKNNEVLVLSEDFRGQSLELKATLLKEKEKDYVIAFNWNLDIDFAEVLSFFGHMPIPPYLNRQDRKEDISDYQTVYASKQGAVAAPTAGLHFTSEVFDRLSAKGIKTEFITLHVSAGTFQPIKESNVLNHPMHREQIVFSKNNILKLLNHPGPLICTGTTSLRALESLYWFGIKLIFNRDKNFSIDKLLPYDPEFQNLPERKESMQVILDHMNEFSISHLIGETSIFIYPGYRFKMCDQLVTNFHQPESTLLLLVSAFIGEEWKNIYAEALEKNYRFLSYGDACLLDRKE